MAAENHVSPCTEIHGRTEGEWVIFHKGWKADVQQTIEACLDQQTQKVTLIDR